jgi:autophagy-related protein 13
MSYLQFYLTIVFAHMQGKDSKEESGRFSALSSCDSPRQDDLDDADYPFAVDDVDTPVSQPGYV